MGKVSITYTDKDGNRLQKSFDAGSVKITVMIYNAIRMDLSPLAACSSLQSLGIWGNNLLQETGMDKQTTFHDGFLVT